MPECSKSHRRPPRCWSREILFPGIYLCQEVLTLQHWRGAWWSYGGASWTEDADAAIRSAVYRDLEHTWYVDDDGESVPWRPNRNRVADVADALKAVCHLSERINAPAWLDVDGPPVGKVVACQNGLLEVHTRQLFGHDPRFFTLVSVPFAYQPEATLPERWFRFLDDLWGDDEEQILALQEWFGYVLSGRTDLQKMLLMVGPKRSGKGTIGRILAALIGRDNLAAPTLGSLAMNFGLQPLIGKPLALISDARLGYGSTNVVVERLLSISGEDALTVDRKYREPWTGPLPSRVMILSNELPRFGDASGAITSHFVLLTLTASFFETENPALTNELRSELPGILNWALDGLERLSRNGKFTEPSSSRESRIAMEEIASPVAAFIRKCCHVGAALEVPVKALYVAWRDWCDANGRTRAGSSQSFGRELRAQMPTLKIVQPRTADGRDRRYCGIALRLTNNDADRVPGHASEAQSHNGTQRYPSQDPQSASSPETARDGTRASPSWPGRGSTPPVIDVTNIQRVVI